jgi:hypothetical protein
MPIELDLHLGTGRWCAARRAGHSTPRTAEPSVGAPRRKLSSPDRFSGVLSETGAVGDGLISRWAWRGRATSVRRRSTRQSEPLGLPDLETVGVELNRHPVLDHDSPVRVLVPHHRLTAAVARVPGARNIPVIDSAAFRQAAVGDLAPDYLANKVGIHSRVFADIGISSSISVFKYIFPMAAMD